MTDAKREALVEAMAIAVHEHRRRLTPLVVSFGWYDLDPEDQQRLRDEARAALAVAEAAIRADERERLLNKLEGECEAGMSRAAIYRKRACEDSRASEEQHQEGRWHAHRDMAEFVATLRARGKV